MRARTSAVTLAKANERYNKLSIINSSLDLGNGMTLEIYDGKIKVFSENLKAYNALVAKVDDDGTKLDAMEKDLIEYGTRMLSGVGSKYGFDSEEYGQAGGTPRSERKRPVRKPKST